MLDDPKRYKRRDYSALVVEDNVPIPLPKNLGASLANLFRGMRAGQSVFVPGEDTVSMRSRVPAGIRPDFTSRTVTENGVSGCRIWRVKGEPA